jgi:hypothetical protein
LVFAGRCRMLVSERVIKSTVFIGTKPESTFYPKGTGFIVVYEEFGHTFLHLVTAKHVIALLRDMGAIAPWIRVNTSDGYAKEFEAPYSYWTFHPSDDTTDVAVCPFNIHAADFDVTWIPLIEMAATAGIIQKSKIGPGEEVVIVGLFRSHYGHERNRPVVRAGTIALLDDEPVYTKWSGYTAAYLVEAHSIGGLSGSPAFVQMAPIRVVDEKAQYTEGRQYYLLGLVSGHFDLQSIDEDSVPEETQRRGGINSGVGVVIPVEKIIETVEHPDLSRSRHEFAMKKHAGRSNSLP